MPTATVNIPSQVLTYANLAAFPVSGELLTIYIAEDTNLEYRWTDVAYQLLGASGSSVQSVTGDGVDNTDPLNPILSFPTSSEIGLGNVDNTSDANKPISSATQTALNNKEPLKGSDDNYVTDAQLVVISNTSGTNTGNETAATIGAIVNGATNYTPPLDSDKIGIWDVANSLFKSLTWANLKVALSSIFAPLNSVVDITSLCTITGWASFTTCVVTRIDLGNAYLVNVYISGVSNSGTASVQLDFTSSINCGNYSYAVSNGSGVYGRVLIAAGSDTIDWRANAAGASFVATGTKLISGQFWLPKP